MTMGCNTLRFYSSHHYQFSFRGDGGGKGSTQKKGDPVSQYKRDRRSSRLSIPLPGFDLQKTDKQDDRRYSTTCVTFRKPRSWLRERVIIIHQKNK